MSEDRGTGPRVNWHRSNAASGSLLEAAVDSLAEVVADPDR